MKVPRMALDSSGRVMINTMTPTGPSNIAGQKLLMYSICANTSGVAASDTHNGGFRYSSVGALRMHDATAVLPTVNIHDGVAMTTDGEVCYTTDAIAGDVGYSNGVAVDTSGRVYVTAISPTAWFKYGTGITTDTGVSNWADQSGNGNDLVQATGSAQPALQSDSSILFDGSSDFLKCAAFTLNQPITVYLLFRQVTWTGGEYIYDGETINTLLLQQTNAGTSPQLRIFNVSGSASITALQVGTYGVVTAVFNGASSLFYVNHGTPTTANLGTTAAAGFIIGASVVGTGFSNIQVKECALFSTAHSAATRWNMINYLMDVGAL